MPVYRAHRAGGTGHAIGILLLDFRAPLVPGDVGNATTYSYPVLFRTVPGASSRRVFSGDRSLDSAVIEAAEDLESQGVRGITSDCGFFIKYQQVVAPRVKIPVFLSSLLQLPFIGATLDPSRTIGVICANAPSLQRSTLAACGIDPERVVVCGLETEPVFGGSVTGGCPSLDTDALRAEVVHVACRLQHGNPRMGAILIECSMLPPYSEAVQSATGLPVFDYITMIDTYQRVVDRRSTKPRCRAVPDGLAPRAIREY
jgi:hypothetical protein